MSPGTTAALGYYWGDDEYGLDQAALALAKRMEAEAGERVERVRVKADARTIEQATNRLAEIAERIGTAPFFGGGTLVIVAEPGALARMKTEGPSLTDLVGLVAPGNGLAFTETLDGFGKRTAAGEALSRTVAEAGGEVREVRAPKEGHMVRWIEERARERGVRLGRGASQELATRVGAFVREGDVDRRQQGRLAAGELDKLALYRLDAEVSADDVKALVPEAVPGSIWAFLDAVAIRQTAEAVRLAELLVPSTPELVLLAVLHRRVRELLQVADLATAKTAPAEVMRLLKMKGYPAEKLMRNAQLWTVDELERALNGLFDMDAALKGRNGQGASEGQFRLALTLWLTDHLPSRAGGRRRG
jgi:DNA polymerase III delta subunit